MNLQLNNYSSPNDCIKTNGDDSTPRNCVKSNGDDSTPRNCVKSNGDDSTPRKRLKTDHKSPFKCKHNDHHHNGICEECDFILPFPTLHFIPAEHSKFIFNGHDIDISDSPFDCLNDGENIKYASSDEFKSLDLLNNNGFIFNARDDSLLSSDTSGELITAKTIEEDILLNNTSNASPHKRFHINLDNDTPPKIFDDSTVGSEFDYQNLNVSFDEGIENSEFRDMLNNDNDAISLPLDEVLNVLQNIEKSEDTQKDVPNAGSTDATTSLAETYVNVNAMHFNSQPNRLSLNPLLSNPLPSNPLPSNPLQSNQLPEPATQLLNNSHINVPPLKSNKNSSEKTVEDFETVLLHAWRGGNRTVNRQMPSEPSPKPSNANQIQPKGLFIRQNHSTSGQSSQNASRPVCSNSPLNDDKELCKTIELIRSLEKLKIRCHMVKNYGRGKRKSARKKKHKLHDHDDEDHDDEESESEKSDTEYDQLLFENRFGCKVSEKTNDSKRIALMGLIKDLNFEKSKFLNDSAVSYAFLRKDIMKGFTGIMQIASLGVKSPRINGMYWETQLTVLQGELQVTVESGRPFKITAGNELYIPPDRLYSVHNHRPDEDANVYFEVTLVEDIPEKLIR